MSFEEDIQLLDKMLSEESISETAKKAIRNAIIVTAKANNCSIQTALKLQINEVQKMIRGGGLIR